MKQILIAIAAAAFSLLTAAAQETKTNPYRKTQLYDENIVPQYTLPELLRTESGQIVTTAAEWEKVRRPELLETFAREVYGRQPKGMPEVSYKVLEESSDAIYGEATRTQTEITFTRRGVTRTARLLVYLPRKAAKPVPVFLMLNFDGNQSVSYDPAILPSQFSTKERGCSRSRWAIEKAIKAGYGVATANYHDFFPDDKSTGFARSIWALYPEQATEGRLTDTGTAIAAWAWGYSRLLDCLTTDKRVDPKAVIIMGHSRLGKSSLWAAACDQRFAIVVSNNSGCSGAAISRRTYGETVGAINWSFPHWFAQNYHKYNGNESDLPVDQHELLALMAPRPLYVASATDDQWSDPHGELIGAIKAGPAYRLYGFDGLPETAELKRNEAYTGRVAFHYRRGIHDVTDYDWDHYIAFADKWLGQH